MIKNRPPNTKASVVPIEPETGTPESVAGTVVRPESVAAESVAVADWLAVAD